MLEQAQSQELTMKENREFYRRHLPHYQPFEAEFHVVFRLVGSLPAEVVEWMREERSALRSRSPRLQGETQSKSELFMLRPACLAKYEHLLDGSSLGPRWLRDARVAAILSEAMHYRDGKQYDLYAYSIMPNHVHMVFRTVRRTVCPTDRVTDILRKLKWNTALRANRVLGRTGSFWKAESYDHVIRTDEELSRTIWYVLHNPVLAGLASSWRLWPWTYCKAEWDTS
jgi:REP element-mobilizing transposase RayT